MRVRTKTTAWLLVLAAGCGPAMSGTSQAPAGSGTVWIDTGGGLERVDLRSGDVVFESASNAIGTPDLSRIFEYRFEDGATQLIEVDADGAELGRLEVAGKVEATVVSGSGDRVAFTERVGSASLWDPVSRARSSITVADVSAGTTRTYELDGNFEPEAFSVDDRKLYTIEYIPAEEPTHYRVRILRLATGKVSPIGRLKLQAPGQMRGTGRMQVYAPSGDELYTLYTQQGPNDLHGAADQVPSDANAFIHLLNLRFGWAHCIDLPQPFGSGDATASAIAVSPDGSRLYVTDWSNGALAVVDPSKLKVLRSIELDLGGADDETFAAVTEDRLYVAGNNEIVAIEVESLEMADRWDMGAEVGGLGLTSHGRLAVAVDGEVSLVDEDTGMLMASTRVDDAKALLTRP